MDVVKALKALDADINDIELSKPTPNRFQNALDVLFQKAADLCALDVVFNEVCKNDIEKDFEKETGHQHRATIEGLLAETRAELGTRFQQHVREISLAISGLKTRIVYFVAASMKAASAILK